MNSPRPWRTGWVVRRTVYDSHNRLIGTMDSVEDAQLVVAAVNGMWAEVAGAHRLRVERLRNQIEQLRQELENCHGARINEIGDAHGLRPRKEH